MSFASRVGSGILVSKKPARQEMISRVRMPAETINRVSMNWFMGTRAHGNGGLT